jgi:hypothetical protein
MLYYLLPAQASPGLDCLQPAQALPVLKYLSLEVEYLSLAVEYRQCPHKQALPSIASCPRFPAACTSPSTLFFSLPTFSLFPKIREGQRGKKTQS